jgi:hypothetical protein
VAFARVFLVMLFAEVLARLAGMRNGLVTMPALPLTRKRGSPKWQRSQTKRNDDCPNQFFHNVISVPFTLADALVERQVTTFYFRVETPCRIASSSFSSAGVRR